MVKLFHAAAVQYMSQIHFYKFALLLNHEVMEIIIAFLLLIMIKTDMCLKKKYNCFLKLNDKISFSTDVMLRGINLNS